MQMTNFNRMCQVPRPPFSFLQGFHLSDFSYHISTSYYLYYERHLRVDPKSTNVVTYAGKQGLRAQLLHCLGCPPSCCDENCAAQSLSLWSCYITDGELKLCEDGSGRAIRV